MHLFKSRDVAEALANLLERERSAVLKADFEALRDIGVEKSRLIAAVEKQVADPEKLLMLRQKLQHNQHLLEAAGKGIRAAADLLDAHSRHRDPLQTYDQSGQRQKSKTGPATFERRA